MARGNVAVGRGEGAAKLPAEGGGARVRAPEGRRTLSVMRSQSARRARPRSGLLLVWAAAAALSPAARAADAAPPAAAGFDFENGALGAEWSASDAEAKLSITADAANVASGKGALEFLYPARQGAFEQMGVTGLTVAEANCLSLKLKATSPTSVSLGVQERGGATYQGLLWIPADQWVQIGCRLDDLILAEGSTDASGRLEAAEIGGFFLADLANLPGEVGRALGWKEGEQRVWLDDLGFAQNPKAPSRGKIEAFGGEWLAVVESFESAALWVLPIRQAGLKLVDGAPKAGKQALEMTYSLGRGRWVGVVAAPPGWIDRSAATKLRLWLRSPLSARVVIVLEERDGTKYESSLKTPADNAWHEAVIPLSDFLIDDETPDENAALDAGQIHRVILLVDTFDADVRANGTGTVTVDDIGFVMPTQPTQP
jgi:hypothetical protein